MDRGGPGVIDFQDALRGPIGYDLVSLLKDCYISWSRERVERWVKGYRRVLGNLGANVGDSEYQFLRWFDLIGVQRHIKVLGIFCRLWHRDGKIGYLNDLPLTFDYVRDACRLYPELVEFGRWLEWRIAPLMGEANAREVLRSQRMPAKRAKPKKRKTAKRPAKRRKSKQTVRKTRARRARVAPKRKVVSRRVVKRKVAKRKVTKRKVARRKVAKRPVKRVIRRKTRVRRTQKKRRSRRSSQ
jgi:hypothetical protein